MSKLLPRIFIPVLILAAVVAVPDVSAGTISLAWDPLDHPDLLGYRVYYGTSPDQLSQIVPTGTSPEVTLTGLASCTKYYIAVKGVAGDGSESAVFSNVVSGWGRPEPSGLAPQTIERGASGAYTLSGDNFQAGATVLVSNPSVSVNGVTVTGCSQLTVQLSADPDAAVGPVEITVVNPDQVYGAVAGLLEVVADQTPPTITSLRATDVGSTTATIAWDTDEAADGQVFFREAGGTSWQPSEIDTAMTTSHAIALNGLSPDTEYEYYARSADAVDNVSEADGPANFTTSPNGFAYMRIETESAAVTTPLESVADSGAFGGRYVQPAIGTPDGTTGNPAGTVDFGFTTTDSATWYVWLRMYAPTNQDDAWFEGMDGAALGVVQASGRLAWEWVEARSYNLDAGSHTLTLGGYEPGVRVDRVLITDDPAFLPSEQPGDDVTPPAPVAGLAATPGDAAVTLTWTNPSSSDLERVLVRYAIGTVAPANPHDGMPVADLAASPGSGGATAHSGLVNGTTYAYAVFAVDAEGNVSERVTATATPEQPIDPPGTVQNLRRTDRLPQ